jgi:catechol 2,3-dioxygenase-like lactoylglutathione lyase family enzyme
MIDQLVNHKIFTNPAKNLAFRHKFPKVGEIQGEFSMITGIQDIYYSVTQPERAVKFYTEALGMKLISKDDYWIALECAGVRIGLHPEENAIPRVPRDSHGAHAGATLTLKSDDIAQDKARLVKAGAVILGDSDQPWGHMLVFEDPDGNVLKLMNPKY